MRSRVQVILGSRAISGPKEPFEHVDEWRALILSWQIIGVNEFIAEPGKAFGVECIDQPIDHPPHPRNAHRIRVICKPDIERKIDYRVDRYDPSGNGMDISRQPSNAGTFGNCPQEAAADI